MKLTYGLFAIFLAFHTSSAFIQTIKENVVLEMKPTTNGIKLTVSLGDTVILTGTLASQKDVSNVNCIGLENCQIGNSQFSFLPSDEGLKFRWVTEDEDTIFTDCFDFGEDTQWYGGPERRLQVWPVQKMSLNAYFPYTIRKDDNFGIAERYWLNSKGIYIFVDDKVPLFVNQIPRNENDNGNICFVSKLASPYIKRSRNILEYTLVYQENAKLAHLHAINNYLGKPKGHPNTKMISEPIFTTWAKYKRDISDVSVLEFAKSIRDRGYQNGQLEIDDNWETCYGNQEFVEDKFSNIRGIITELKNMNFRVTLWIHPFVNDYCWENSKEGIMKGYFVTSVDGLVNATWWNGNQIGHQIDFTKKEAAEWWSNRVRKLQYDPQLDSFKFDAGETDYAQQPSLYLNVDPEQVPNILTSSYIRTCAEFGDSIEVRAGWRTQELPIFVRMLDKDTSWSIDNGLASLVTTLLQMNLNGYTMVLPDMIGGNGYSGDLPTAELLVRWTQANTFMPAMQFSYLPWEITSEEFDAPAIVQKNVNLHEQYSNIIIKAMENSIQFGSPVNPPIWWIDPTDAIALASDDEFLVGEDILVAPVLIDGQRSRNVYLPKGTWRDGNNGTLYQGPIMLDYPAPIDILPYFISEK